MKHLHFQTLLCFLIFLLACSPKIQLTRSRLMMGHVPVNITIKTEAYEKEKATEAMDYAYALAEKLESKFSDYQAQSDISCLNKKAGKDYCTVSSETTQILRDSLELNRLSEGAYDIRFRSLSEKGKNGSMIFLLNEIKISHPDMRIGISSMAKGFILDRIGDYLSKQGFKNVLINAGGDIKVVGGPWKVAIQIPGGDYGKNTPVFEIKDEALTSAGNYENSQNIIDPKTGKAIASAQAVTVIAPNAAWGNAIATAFFVLGEKKSSEILKNFPEIKMIWVDSKGKMKSYSSPSEAELKK